MLGRIGLAVAAGLACMTGADAPAPRIPLCPGLTIVTAVTARDGDYESIKTIEAVTPEEVRLKYSSEAMFSDLFSAAPPQLKTTVHHRTVLAGDLESATMYQQVFLEKSAETIPGTTAIGTSAAVLRSLKTNGEADLSISNAYAGLELGADRNKFPSYYNYMQAGKIRKVGTPNVTVIVNDQPVELPAIQAQGDLVGDKVEFVFLDDERNPLTLAFRIGIGGIQPLTPEARKLCDAMRASKAGGPSGPSGRCDLPDGGDRDTLRVVKIKCPCAAQLAAAGGSSIEQALAGAGKVDIYSIYFSFNSDAIRPESEPALKEICGVLQRHPAWKLRIAGHTDGVGADQYNLDLSKRRAAAVKDALVKRYGAAAGRLATTGFGKSQPKDSNATLEGRARNRRVELARM